MLNVSIGTKTVPLHLTDHSGSHTGWKLIRHTRTVVSWASYLARTSTLAQLRRSGEVFRVNFGEELYYKGTAALTAIYGGDGTMEGSGRVRPF